MFRLASALAILCSSIQSTSAFSTAIRADNAARSPMTVLNYHPEPSMHQQPPMQQQPAMDMDMDPLAYDRAADCANNYGMCDVDELLDLSQELDEYLGCFVENGPEACDKEIDDRQELSEALLVQGEMREHDRYVQEGNVFPFDANTNSQTPMNGNENTNPQAAPWRQEDEFFWGDNNLRP